MKKHSSASPVLKLTLLFVLFTSSFFAYADNTDNQFSGSWFGTFDAEGVVTQKIIATLTRDGKMYSSDSTDFFSGFLGEFQTPTQGLWLRTKNNGVRFTLLHLDMDMRKPVGDYSYARCWHLK